MLAPMSTTLVAGAHAGTLRQQSRVLWLDVLRALCAFQIVGFHWLRAAVKTSAAGVPSGCGLILQYRQLNFGVRGAMQCAAPHATDAGPLVLANRSLNLLFGAGWEAVFVFVLLSGTALSLSLSVRSRPISWPRWVGRRLKRILLPFYLVAGMLATCMLIGMAATSTSNSPLLHTLHAKILENVGPDVSGVVWSQLLLFDPHQRLGTAVFLAPAWWFVPAILLAYALFPLYMRLLRRLGQPLFLALGALISIASYTVLLRHHVQEFSWWFVVCNECFNFFLGILVGMLLRSEDGRKRAEHALGSPTLFAVSLLLLISGNVMNLYYVTYAFSSLVFTPSLCFSGAAVAYAIRNWRPVRALLQIDPFHLYLLHQPLAFPLILISEALFGRLRAAHGSPRSTLPFALL